MFMRTKCVSRPALLAEPSMLLMRMGSLSLQRCSWCSFTVLSFMKIPVAPESIMAGVSKCLYKPCRDTGNSKWEANKSAVRITAETLSYADTTLSSVAVGADEALLVHGGGDDAEDEDEEEEESVRLEGVSMMRGESEGSGFTVQVPSVSRISSTKETCFD